MAAVLHFQPDLTLVKWIGTRTGHFSSMYTIDRIFEFQYMFRLNLYLSSCSRHKAFPEATNVYRVDKYFGSQLRC